MVDPPNDNDRELLDMVQHQIDTRALEVANETAGRLDQHLRSYEWAEKERAADRKHTLEMVAELKTDMREGFADMNRTHARMFDVIERMGTVSNTRWMNAMKIIIGLLLTIVLGIVAWEWNRLVEGVTL